MTADTHPSTQSVLDYVVWVPAAFYAVMLAWGFMAADYNSGVLTLSFSVAIFALFALAHGANARRIRELDAAVRHLRGTLR